MAVEPLILNVQQIEEASGQCESVVLDAMRLGHLRFFKVGRRNFSKPPWVSEWLEFLRKESDAGRPVYYRRRLRAA